MNGIELIKRLNDAEYEKWVKGGSDILTIERVNGEWKYVERVPKAPPLTTWKKLTILVRYTAWQLSQTIKEVINGK